MSDEPLSWDQIVATCSRTHPRLEDDARMLDVRVLSFVHDARASWDKSIDAVVVPTRMHDPGFYLRSPNDTPLWAFWANRDEQFLLGEFYRLVEAGRVAKR